MVRVRVFNNNSILSLTAARTAVILFVFLSIGAKNVCIFAQTAEEDDEQSDPSQAKLGDEGVPYLMILGCGGLFVAGSIRRLDGRLLSYSKP
ncbi:MAG: hypothetical protein KJ893_02760 [Candidatus Omnitrophica bacterium]|nr:hypothetical protein [Candidatus Omnitrophota bacterium]